MGKGKGEECTRVAWIEKPSRINEIGLRVESMSQWGYLRELEYRERVKMMPETLVLMRAKQQMAHIAQGQNCFAHSTKVQEWSGSNDLKVIYGQDRD